MNGNASERVGIPMAVAAVQGDLMSVVSWVQVFLDLSLEEKSEVLAFLATLAGQRMQDLGIIVDVSQN